MQSDFFLCIFTKYPRHSDIFRCLTATCQTYSCSFLIETHSTVNFGVECIDKFDSCPHLLELTAGRNVFFLRAIQKKYQRLHISMNPAVRASGHKYLWNKNQRSEWSIKITNNFRKKKSNFMKYQKVVVVFSMIGYGSDWELEVAISKEIFHLDHIEFIIANKKRYFPQGSHTILQQWTKSFKFIMHNRGPMRPKLISSVNRPKNSISPNVSYHFSLWLWSKCRRNNFIS